MTKRGTKTNKVGGPKTNLKTFKGKKLISSSKPSGSFLVYLPEMILTLTSVNPLTYRLTCFAVLVHSGPSGISAF